MLSVPMVNQCLHNRYVLWEPKKSETNSISIRLARGSKRGQFNKRLGRSRLYLLGKVYIWVLQAGYRLDPLCHVSPPVRSLLNEYNIHINLMCVHDAVPGNSTRPGNRTNRSSGKSRLSITKHRCRLGPRTMHCPMQVHVVWPGSQLHLLQVKF